jgi:hypothetical protein
MPFTPLHFGPGAALKALVPAQFSFAVFAFSQVLIDLEPLAFWALTGDPIHRYLHTWLGAALVAALSYAPGRRVSEWALRVWNSQLDAAQARWLGFDARIGRGAAFWGAALGAFSHVALDGIMHSDLRPFAPFSQARPWLSAISIEQLHLLCVAAGAAGVAVLALLRWRRRI